MNVVKILLVLFLCLSPVICIAGKAYYVDPSSTDPFEDGSFAHPWNSIKDVNDHKFNNGDDVYFKVNSKLIATEKLDIDWDGTPNDRVIIGAYYDNGLFGLNGNARPIIDGNNYKVPATETGLINYWSRFGYVTVQDLQIQYSGAYGINLSYKYTGDQDFTQHNIVRNCFIKNAGKQGIVFARASYGLIENNTVEFACHNEDSGAGIEITGQDSEFVTQHNTVRGNKVYWCGEGIGHYKGARYSIIENNIVYDCRSFLLYSANARDVIFRNNVVYETDSQPRGDGRDRLIAVDAEGHVASIIKITGNTEIYGNYLAGGSHGIAISNNAENVGLYQSNNIIYNNRIVDCNVNFYFSSKATKFPNNKIYNNISFVIDDYNEGLLQANNFSPTGVIWEGNYWSTSASGNATEKEINDNLSLLINSGWRSLKSGTVTTSKFQLTTEEKIDNTLPAVDRVKNLKIIALLQN